MSSLECAAVPLFEAFRSAFASLHAYGLRSLLSILAVSIGIAGMIAVGAIASGARQVVDEELLNLGANLIVVNAASVRRGGVRLGAGTAPMLTEDDLDAIRNETDGVAAATAFVNTREQVIAAAANWQPYVQGVAQDWFEVMEWEIARGRAFEDLELRRGEIVAVLGSTVARELFGDGDPIGQTVRIRTTPFRVIGVAAAKGGDRDDVVFVPLDAARRRVLGFSLRRGSVMAIFVKFKQEADIAPGVAQMAALLRERRRLSDDQEDDFTTLNLTEVAHAKSVTTRTLAFLLAAVAGVSLVVGGIGIMNILLAAVSQRRREIGVRIALGARPRDIGAQFLAEAVTLGGIGALVGSTVGIAAAHALAVVAGWPMIVSPGIVFVSAGAAILLAAIFGSFPAYRAARLDAGEALRSE